MFCQPLEGDRENDQEITKEEQRKVRPVEQRLKRHIVIPGVRTFVEKVSKDRGGIEKNQDVKEDGVEEKKSGNGELQQSEQERTEEDYYFRCCVKTATEGEGRRDWEESRKRLKQNNIMKAIIRKVPDKKPSKSLCAHCDWCRKEVNAIPIQKCIPCTIEGQERNHAPHRPLQVL